MFKIDTGQARIDEYDKPLDLTMANEDIARVQQAKQNQQNLKRKEENGREENAYSDINDLGKTAIYEGHRPEFAQKMTALKDYTLKNINKIRSGDPQAIMGFQDMKNDIQTTGELSKNFREQKEAVDRSVLAQESKEHGSVRDETFDYLKNAGHDENGQMNFQIDPSKIKSNTDLIKDFKTNVRPIIDDVAKGNTYDYTNPDTGIKTTITKDNLTEDQSKNFLKDELKKHVIYEQASHDLSKEPEDVQKKYGHDVNSYYMDKLLPYARVNRDKITHDDTKDGENPKVEIPTDENPMLYKVKTLATDGTTMDGTVRSFGRISHTPVKATTALSPSVRTIDGNKPPPNTDVVDVDYGEVNVIPVYKSGTTTTINGKKVDIGGNQVTNEMLDREKKLGVIEYKPYANGIAKVRTGQKNEQGYDIYKNISITRPASEIQGALKKAKVNLSEVDKIAAEKNKAETNTTASTDSGFNAKWATLKSGQTMVGPDGKTYKKK